MAISIYWANAAGFCVGAIVNVLLIRKFVFPNSRFKLSADLPLTFAVNGLMLGMGMGLLWVFVNALSINPYGAKLLANGITFILNYIIRAVFFRKK
jgi:putative flippase GtrA